jgi:hypothetical protein
MKNLFIFCFLLIGCNQVMDLSEEVSVETNDEVENNYVDLENDLPKELGCPVDYKEVVINNHYVWMAVPTICGIDPIDQGRPVEIEDPTQLDEILEEVEQY